MNDDPRNLRELSDEEHWNVFIIDENRITGSSGGWAKNDLGYCYVYPVAMTEIINLREFLRNMGVAKHAIPGYKESTT